MSNEPPSYSSLITHYSLLITHYCLRKRLDRLAHCLGIGLARDLHGHDDRELDASGAECGELLAAAGRWPDQGQLLGHPVRRALGISLGQGGSFLHESTV